MRVVHPICAGMDVHKEDVKVCLVWRDDVGERCEEVRTFSTMTRPLISMREWLESYGCKVVVIESTGNYWKPIFNLLDGDFEVMLVNPEPVPALVGSWLVARLFYAARPSWSMCRSSAAARIQRSL